MNIINKFIEETVLKTIHNLSLKERYGEEKYIHKIRKHWNQKIITEVSEVISELNKFYFQGNSIDETKLKLTDEIGDVIHAICAVSFLNNLNIKKVFEEIEIKENIHETNSIEGQTDRFYANLALFASNNMFCPREIYLNNIFNMVIVVMKSFLISIPDCIEANEKKMAIRYNGTYSEEKSLNKKDKI